MSVLEYQWFLPAVIASFASRPAKFFAGFAMLIATLGNQIAGMLFTVCLSTYTKPINFSWFFPLRKRFVWHISPVYKHSPRCSLHEHFLSHLLPVSNFQ